MNTSTTTLPFRTAIIWALVSGALALSWELVWSRLFNFVTGSRAESFGAMLGSYLLGLAAGSLLSRKWFDKEGTASRMPHIGTWVVAASLVAFATAPLTASLISKGLWTNIGLLFVAASGTLLGVVFPMVCHRALSAGDDSGQRMSFLYVANIIGSGFGSLFTGFVLFDHLGIAALSLVLLLVGHLWAESMAGWKLPLHVRLCSLTAIVAVPFIFDGFYERLMLKEKHRPGYRFANIIESKHGVITVDEANAVYGNGAYDGVIKTSLLPLDRIIRAYAPSAFLENIEDVLVIGVSSGSWTRILSCHPQVKRVTAIEISAGYLKLISQYPEVAPILSDPKVDVVIDDGRRWLRQHPDRKFDLVVMNTAIHWREFSTAVLSREMLEMVKGCLKPRGAVMWNCTGSDRAIRTGMDVFPHTVMINNFCMASMSPLEPDRDRWEKILKDYRIDNMPVIDPTSQRGRTDLDRALLLLSAEGIPMGSNANIRCMTRKEMEESSQGAVLITDDNLGHEYPGPERGSSKAH